MQVCLLLKRGANQNLVDEYGRNAYDVALRTTNADNVTLLRLAGLNEEVRQREGLLRDDTYHDVFQDFIQMAFDDDCADRRDQQQVEVLAAAAGYCHGENHSIDSSSVDSVAFTSAAASSTDELPQHHEDPFTALW